MMKSNTSLHSVPLNPPVDKYAPVEGQPFPVRIPAEECLRLAARKRGELEPEDVLALLAGDIAAERLRIKQMGDQIDALRAMLFGKFDPAPSNTLALIERLNRIRLLAQAELRHSLGLLHQMVGSRQVSLQLDQIEFHGKEATIGLGG
jgi:hypothetical protein